MVEEITADRMAELLDDWAAQSDPFNSEVRPRFGLAKDQLGEPIVMAAATFADFRMLGGSRSSDKAVPFVTLFGQASEHLQYLATNHPECFAYWREFAVHTEHRLVTAMLNDLLWTVRYQDYERPFVYAKAAIDHYLTFYDEVAQTTLEHKSLHMYDLLSRVVDLVNHINAGKDYHSKVAQRCGVWLADRSSGDSFWAIRAAACLPKEHRPADLQGRIESLHVTYATSSDSETWTGRAALFQVELEMAERDRDRGVIMRTRASAAQMFIEESSRMDSALRAGRHLQEAEEWAKGALRESALMEKIREIRNSLNYDGDLHEFTTEQSISHDQIQPFIDEVATAESVAAALDLVAGYGYQLLGDVKSIEAAAENIYQRSSFVNLMSHVHIVHANVECCRPQTEEAKRRRVLAAHFRLHSLIQANVIIAPCLATVATLVAATQPAIRDYLTRGGMIDSMEAEAFARAFGYYWAEDFDAVAHVAIPRIETVLRGLAEKAGIVIWFPPQGDECGGLKGLKPILNDLRVLIGEANEGMLSYLLVDNHAMNLRDNYAHGVPSEDPRADAALVLWIVLWLARLRPVENTVAPTSE